MVRVRVAFDRVLLVGRPNGGLPVVGGSSGARLAGLTLFVRFDRVFESFDGLAPAGVEEVNRRLRVSFDRVRGIGFRPDGGLGCGWEVVSWLVDEIDLSDSFVVRSRPVGREVFEGVLERYRGLFVEDGCLQSTAWAFTDADSGEPVELGLRLPASSSGAWVGGRGA